MTMARIALPEYRLDDATRRDELAATTPIANGNATPLR